MKTYDLVNVAMPRIELIELCNMLGAYDKGAPFSKQSIHAGGILFVWTADVLAKRRPIPDAARRLILSYFGPEIQDAGLAISKALEDQSQEIPAYVLSIADNTLVGLTKTKGWLDLRTGDSVVDPPHPPIELVSYNLTGLFIAMDRLYTQRGDLNARRAASESRGSQ